MLFPKEAARPCCCCFWFAVTIVVLMKEEENHNQSMKMEIVLFRVPPEQERGLLCRCGDALVGVGLMLVCVLFM